MSKVIQYLVIRRNHKDNLGQVHPWHVELWTEKPRGTPDVLETNLTAPNNPAAKRMVKKMGYAGRIDWSRIDGCLQVWL